MPTIKLKKGYPTSDGVMHDKHADAVRIQCGIDFDNLMTRKGFTPDDIDTFKELNIDDMKTVSDFIKYCRKPVPAAAPKKKTTKK